LKQTSFIRIEQPGRKNVRLEKEGDKKMKKVMTNLLVVLITVGFVCLPAISTEAKNIDQNVKVNFGEQDFLLINSTGVEINALYITPHNSKDWGEDILGADTLLNGEELEINFPSKTKAKMWDLRIEDEEGNYLEWDNLNLLKISSVELLYNKGKTTAILN
jgi:hypothetical protein